MGITERNIEDDLVTELIDLKYQYRPDIRDRDSMEANFREKFEALNGVTLNDNEFQMLLAQIVTNDTYTAAASLRNRETFIREDGLPLNYTLVDIKDWCKNSFEVINQLRINTYNSHHRYDIILLINGVPIVQIELKTLGISPKRAMEQISSYKKDSGNGYTNSLLCFVQLFIVTNYTDTYYFTNNNEKYFSFDAAEQFLPVYQFADRNNRKITDLHEFADKFLAKCTLGEMIGKYMVLVESERKLLMMRPYQIYAVKSIVDCIDQNCGNGYIWHTTGSGKTLTSFKASTLLKFNENIHKCLFVVDRKDLDRQTREEFNKFQENCVEENTNTATLVNRLLSEDYADKVIVTTIQKLGVALDENSRPTRDGTDRGGSVYRQQLKHLRDKRLVFIFDECHRSQFGENHQAIKDFFPNSQLFGFTGTPIFEENATIKQIRGGIATLRTTEELFQKELHAYTITHAIEDQNVLRFHVDYYKPNDYSVPGANQPVSKRAVVEAILDKHDVATGGRMFNALLATASINDAIEYFEVFRQLQSEQQVVNSKHAPLKIAAVFSPPAEGNKDVQQIQDDLPQEREDNRDDPEGKKAALKSIIGHYNEQYGTNHDINNFDGYYKDIQQRIKEQKFPNHDLPERGAEKIDITIVVDMLLTGFDAQYLNTLYVDKNLKHHGMIQAFSRTNRVLNKTKPYGHIIDFRQQQGNVDAAITLFSGVNSERANEIWLVDKAPKVIERFKRSVEQLDKFMESQGLQTSPDQVNNLKGDAARMQFINRFKEVKRLKSQLDQYTDLTGEQREQIEEILPEDDVRGFSGVYNKTVKRLKDKEDVPGDNGGFDDTEVEETDYELVLFASAIIDYDYIMTLMARFSGQDPKRIEVTREQLVGLIDSDSKFIDDGEELAEYIYSLKEGEGLGEEEIRAGFERFRQERRAIEIANLAKAHGLTNESLANFVDAILDRMIFDGEKLTGLMEQLDLPWHERHERELALMTALVPLLNKRAQGKEISGLGSYTSELAQ